jgi:hypothetical protein
MFYRRPRMRLMTFVNGNREWVARFVVVEHANEMQRELTFD